MLLKYSSLVALAALLSSIGAENNHDPVKGALTAFFDSVAAGESYEPNPPKGITLATFEESGKVPLRPIRQVGTYKGISYNGFQALSLPAGELLARSGHNVALYGTQAATNLGRPNLETAGGPFDLHEFYFGCVLLDLPPHEFESAAACNVTMKSERHDGTEFSQEFQFTPSTKMVRAPVDNRFTQIRVVRFATVPDLQVVTLFDNFVYTLHKR